MYNNIIAIDPGTKAGITIVRNNKIETTYMQNNTPRKATKANPIAEPKHFRLLKFYEAVSHEIYYFDSFDIKPVIIIEGAHSFMRGKAAIEASHKYRAVIQLAAAINNLTYVEVSPKDLKRFATNNTMASKEEMIAAAQKHGYTGTDDNEADSYLLALWGQKKALIDK